MRLNHVANRITRGNLDLMVAFFRTQLGFRVMRKTPEDVWLRQEPATVDIQLSETDAMPVGEDKHNSHISFVSITPEQDLRILAEWFFERGKTTRLGAWSEREFYLDVPDVFVDFVIEAMRPELADYRDGVGS